MRIRVITIALLFVSIVSCRRSQDSFNEQMKTYLADESKLASMSEALDSYQTKKLALERQKKQIAEEAKAQERLKNPVKIDIGNSPVKGKADAKVTIVEFSDFQCPFCSMGERRMAEIAAKYPNDVKFVYKFFPLPGHGLAMPAAKAALAAGKQGRFWQMYAMIFKNQNRLKETDIFGSFAKDLHLDLKKFMSDFDNKENEKIIEKDVEIGVNLGINGTPAFFVNGVLLEGAQPLDKFERVINQFIKK